MFDESHPLNFSLALSVSPFYLALISEVTSQGKPNPASTSNYMSNCCLSRINTSLSFSASAQTAVFNELFLDINLSKIIAVYKKRKENTS